MSENAKKIKSKWFRFAVEGATTDGRQIQRSWIEQMAKNYDPKVFGARVNLEHIKGIFPDGPFKSYGDVLALNAKEITDGALAGKLALFAQIEPHKDLLEMNANKQKVYTSIEVSSKFADTGEAYLIGLALTDDPASLGTEFLEFSAKASVNPLNSRKQDPNNLFSAAEETLIEFEDDQPQSDTAFSSMIERLTGLFKNKADKDSAKFMQLGEIVEQFFTQSAERFSQQHQKMEALQEKYSKLENELNTVKAENQEYKSLLNEMPDSPKRPTSTGGQAEVETDC